MSYRHVPDMELKRVSHLDYCQRNSLNNTKTRRNICGDLTHQVWLPALAQFADMLRDIGGVGILCQSGIGMGGGLLLNGSSKSNLTFCANLVSKISPVVPKSRERGSVIWRHLV